MADYNYAKTTWTDNQTPLSAANMNQIEDGMTLRLPVTNILIEEFKKQLLKCLRHQFKEGG